MDFFTPACPSSISGTKLLINNLINLEKSMIKFLWFYIIHKWMIGISVRVLFDFSVGIDKIGLIRLSRLGIPLTFTVLGLFSGLLPRKF